MTKKLSKKLYQSPIPPEYAAQYRPIAKRLIIFDTKIRDLSRQDVEIIAASFVHEAARKHGNWISVEDQLPGKNIAVLATDGEHIAVMKYDGNLIIQWFVSGLHGYCGDCISDINDEGITHWRPLPELPRGR